VGEWEGVSRERERGVPRRLARREGHPGLELTSSAVEAQALKYQKKTEPLTSPRGGVAGGVAGRRVCILLVWFGGVREEHTARCQIDTKWLLFSCR